MPYSAGLETLQWAREATPGTDLAATSKLVVNKMDFKPMDELYRPPIVRGLIQRNRGFETPVKRWSQWSAEGPVSYEQLQNWLSGTLANVASPTGLSPYVWAFTRNPAVTPTICTFTFERREYDGTTAIQTAWHYAVITKFTLSFADGKPLMFKAEGFARRVQTETYTGALSMPTPEIPPTALTTVFIDSTYGGIGGTQVASQALSGDIEITTGAVPIWTADARADLDFTTIGHDPNKMQVNASLVVLLGAQFSLEKTAAEAATLRAIRLSIAGTASRALTFDFLAKHVGASLYEYGELDGQKIVKMNLQESTDGTNLLAASLTNTISTYA